MKTKRILLFIGIVSALLFAFSACTIARGNANGYMLAAVGSDLSQVKVTATEFTAFKVDNSTAFIEASKRLKQAFDAYLIYQGLTFIGGKYFDQAGAELSSAETIRLNELSNAKSAAEAAEKTKQLELMLAQ